jgi:hypothetical protein
MRLYFYAHGKVIKAFSHPRIARQVKGMVAEINYKPIFLGDRTELDV